MMQPKATVQKLHGGSRNDISWWEKKKKKEMKEERKKKKKRIFDQNKYCQNLEQGFISTSA